MTDVSVNSLPVLVFAPFGKDAALIERVLRESAVVIRTLSNLHELQNEIGEDAGAAIIPE